MNHKKQQGVEKLEKSEEIFRKVFMTSPDLFMISRVSDGLYHAVNEGFTKMLGYTEEEVLHKSSIELGIWVNQNDRKQLVEEMNRKGIVQNFETSFYTKNGDIVPVSVSVSTLDIDGIPHILGTARNISDRINTESLLQLNEKKFHDLFSSMIEGFAYHKIITDKNNEPIDYEFLEINDAFEKLTGLTREKTIGKKVSEALPGTLEDPTDWVHIYGKIALSGKNISFESYSTVVKKWFLVTAYCPQPGYFATLFQDITDKIENEKALQKLNEELEIRVQQRTKELEDSNKDLEAFSNSISHDLRAPLRAIEGFSQFLEKQFKTNLGPEGSRLLNIITENTNYMNRMIMGMMAISKVSSGIVKKNHIEMNRVVDTVYQESVSEEDRDKITLIVSPLHIGYGDTVLIRQVWINLLENAVKFTRNKKNPSITIQSHSSDHQIVYSIKDNGAGFNSKYKNKLFQMFQRLHSTDEFEGTGIGLAIVERIVRKHGGSVWAEGEEETGATFYFSLPQ